MTTLGWPRNWAHAGIYDAPATGYRPQHQGRPAALSREEQFERLMEALSYDQQDEVFHILDQSIEGGPAHSIRFNKISQRESTRGWTPLALAAAQGNLNIVQRLIELGAPIDQAIRIEKKLFTPLALAVMEDHTSVARAILNAPNFGQEGYAREIEIARKLQQYSLRKHLHLAADSEVRAQASARLLQGPSAAALDPIQREALTNFPGDFEAHSQADICPICQSIPGEKGTWVLINGHKRTGDHVISDCCGIRFCKGCFLGLQRHAGRRSPRCPGCRAPKPNYAELRNAVNPLNWRGARIAIPPTPVVISPVAFSGVRAVEDDDPRVTPAFQALGPMYEFHVPAHQIPAEGDEPARDIPARNLILSDVAPELMSHEEATTYCEGLGDGVRLPTREEYKALVQAMRVTDPENVDPDNHGDPYHYDLIPGMDAGWFWSATVDPTDDDQAFSFFGGLGTLDTAFRDIDNAVRCVR